MSCYWNSDLALVRLCSRFPWLPISIWIVAGSVCMTIPPIFSIAPWALPVASLTCLLIPGSLNSQWTHEVPNACSIGEKQHWAAVPWKKTWFHSFPINLLCCNFFHIFFLAEIQACIWNLRRGKAMKERGSIQSWTPFVPDCFPSPKHTSMKLLSPNKSGSQGLVAQFAYKMQILYP